MASVGVYIPLFQSFMYVAKTFYHFLFNSRLNKNYHTFNFFLNMVRFKYQKPTLLDTIIITFT